MVLPASHGQPRFPWYSRTPPDGAPAFDYGALTPCGGPFQVLRLARALLRPARGSRPRTRRTTPAPQRLPAWARRGFRLLPVRSPLLGECSLLLGVLRCFSSPTYLRTPYVFRRGWRGMTPAGLPHSGIDGAVPACGPPSLFAACHALHRPVSPRHPPHTGSCLSETHLALARVRQQRESHHSPLHVTIAFVSILTRHAGRVRNRNAATLPSPHRAKASRTGLRPVSRPNPIFTC